VKRKREFRELQVGNIVQLKGGGPKWKILELEDGKAKVTPTALPATLEEFPVSALEVVSYDLAGD
jgi:hypothetical protein